MYKNRKKEIPTLAGTCETANVTGALGKTNFISVSGWN